MEASSDKKIQCPDCDEWVSPRGMGGHRRFSKRHQEAVASREAGGPKADPSQDPHATQEELDALRHSLAEHEARLEELSHTNEAIYGRLEGHGQLLAATNEELSGLNSTIRGLIGSLGMAAVQPADGSGGSEGSEGSQGGQGAGVTLDRQGQLFQWGQLLVRFMEASRGVGEGGGGGGGQASVEESFTAVINAMGGILKQFGSLRTMFLDELRTIYRVSPEAARAVLEPPTETQGRPPGHVKKAE